ncbi:MAG: TonB-dependent receptor [Bacteroidetes bacterium]|nr:MAG: TonB-dependent receptor [Bacteroidota bacterium]
MIHQCREIAVSQAIKVPPGLVLCVLLCCWLLPAGSLAQSVTLSGYVTDAKNGEVLIGARIFDTLSQRGTYTNKQGFYSLQLPADSSLSIRVSYVGYQRWSHQLVLSKDSSLQVQLVPGITLEVVEIVADRPPQQSPQMSVVSIPVSHIERLPTILGEVDVMRSFQLMPGIQAGAEGTSALYVRGGSPDQNLILLDGVPLYYVNHVGGFLSVFDAAAINHIELYKGAFPARYAGRLSSVMDIRMKEGDKHRHHLSLSMGVVATKAAAEGPLIKGKSSYLLTFRRFNYDLLVRGINLTKPPGFKEPYFTFYDLNAKVTHHFSDKDRLYFSLYAGDDQYIDRSGVRKDEVAKKSEESGSSIRWGNKLMSLRWNHLFSPKLFSNLALSFTHFRYKTHSYWHSQNLRTQQTLFRGEQQFHSLLQDLRATFNMEWYPGNQHHIKWGLSGIGHHFEPNVSSFKEINQQVVEKDTTWYNKPVFAAEFGAYIEDEWKWGSRFSGNVGLHFSLYLVEKQQYAQLQPRASLNYLLQEHLSVKASYARMQQHIHLLTAGNFGLPVSLWVPATSKAPPEFATQYAWGLAYSHPKYGLEASLEGFYKELNQQIDFLEGANFFTGNQNWEDKVVVDGRGRVWGLELLLRKNTGRHTGWIAYTWSKNTRQFTQLNEGKVFPYIYDRPHELSVVYMHTLTKGVHLSASWVFGTGYPVTLPLSGYELIAPQYHDFHFPQSRVDPPYKFEEAFYYGGRNSSRMRNYHRLDLALQFIKKKKRGERIWNLGVYNAYNRRNPFYLYYGYDSAAEQYKLYEFSLFPILPSVSYTRKF